MQEQEFDWKRGRKSAKKDEKGRKRKKRVEKGKKKTGYDKQSAVTENSSSQMCPEKCCEPEESSESVRCHVFVISCPVSIRCFMESGSVYSVKMEFHIPFSEAILSDVLEYYQFTEAAPPDASEPHIS